MTDTLDNLREMLKAHLEPEAGPHSMEVCAGIGLRAVQIADDLRSSIKTYLKIVYSRDPDDMTEEEFKEWEEALDRLDKLTRDLSLGVLG